MATILDVRNLPLSKLFSPEDDSVLARAARRLAAEVADPKKRDVLAAFTSSLD